MPQAGRSASSRGCGDLLLLPFACDFEIPSLPSEQHFAGGERGPHSLQRVQVGEQVFDLLVGHDLAEALHF